MEDKVRERSHHRKFVVALLIAGSAISLMSCGNAPKPSGIDDEKIISRTVRDMETLKFENGNKKQLMRAPLVEEHAFARPSFEEYRQGIELIGYDSLGHPSSRVIADYALHWAEQDLWELNGNVVVEGEEGQKLYTQQLRWDVKIKKIYSHVDCRVEDGEDVLFGVGFDAADDFSRWKFLVATGTIMVNVEPTNDSTAVVPQGRNAGSGSVEDVPVADVNADSNGIARNADSTTTAVTPVKLETSAERTSSTRRLTPSERPSLSASRAKPEMLIETPETSSDVESLTPNQ